MSASSQALTQALALAKSIRSAPEKTEAERHILALDDEVERLGHLYDLARDGARSQVPQHVMASMSGRTMRLDDARKAAHEARTAGGDASLIALDDAVDRLTYALAGLLSLVDTAIWRALPVGANAVATWEDGRPPRTAVRGAVDASATCGDVGIYGGSHWEEALGWQDQATWDIVFVPSTDFLPVGTKVRVMRSTGDPEVLPGEIGVVSRVGRDGSVNVDLDGLTTSVRLNRLDLVSHASEQFDEGQNVLLIADHQEVMAGSFGTVRSISSLGVVVDFGARTRTVDPDDLAGMNSYDVQWGAP